MEPLIDVALIGDNGDVFALKDMGNYEFSGFNMPSWVYRRVSRASFVRVVDSRFYILGKRASNN